MKKYISLIALSGALSSTPIALPLSLGVAATTLVACKTGQSTTNLQSYTDLKNQVAAARVEWADYVTAQKTAVGTIADRSQQSAASFAILAKQNVVNAALQVWFDRNIAYRDAQKASAQTLPAPPDVFDAGNAYLAAVKANKS